LKKDKFDIKKNKLLKISAIIYIFGFIIGIIFACIYKEKYSYDLLNYNQHIFDKLKIIEIDKKNFLYYIIVDKLKTYIIFWFICFTFLGIPNIIYQILKMGFNTGFMLSLISIQYGFKGFVFMIFSQFPHCIIYLPIILIMLYKGFSISKSFNIDGKYNSSTRVNIIKSNLTIIFILFLFIIIGCYLEAYVGYYITKSLVLWF